MANGGFRDVGIKAKVVNKIVREASGMHSYVIVPPPRKKGEVIELDLIQRRILCGAICQGDEEEARDCIFGHRPRSASRASTREPCE